MTEGLGALDTSLCRDGWHTAISDGVIAYVRATNRVIDGKGVCIYRVGSAPDDSVCTTIWDYSGKGRPWKCAACRQPVTPPEAPNGTSSGLAEGVAQ
jgi:hypothetical protein